MQVAQPKEEEKDMSKRGTRSSKTVHHLWPGEVREKVGGCEKFLMVREWARKKIENARVGFVYQRVCVEKLLHDVEWAVIFLSTFWLGPELFSIKCGFAPPPFPVINNDGSLTLEKHECECDTRFQLLKRCSTLSIYMYPIHIRYYQSCSLFN